MASTFQIFITLTSVFILFLVQHKVNSMAMEHPSQTFPTSGESVPEGENSGEPYTIAIVKLDSNSGFEDTGLEPETCRWCGGYTSAECSNACYTLNITCYMCTICSCKCMNWGC